MKIYSFDIETYSENNKLIPFCICTFNGSEYMTFYGTNCTNDFIETLFNKLYNKNIILFSHNLSFDGSLIIQFLKTDNYKINGLFFKGNIYTLEITNIKKLKIVLKCSYRFFPDKLERAETLLLCSPKINFNITNLNKNSILTLKDKIEEYCRNDAKVVLEIIYKYDIIVSNYISNWTSFINSLPSLAMHIYDKRFNIHNVKLFNTIEDDDIVRSSYYGGRCEVFGNPKSNELLYHFDFSGMYAQVMTEEFEYGDFDIEENPKTISSDGFYYIEYTHYYNLPILPTHCLETKKLLFVSGKGSGLYWWEEIELMLQMGGSIDKIYYKLKFYNKGKIFKNFINTFYNLRATSKYHNTICKFITNSVYGRLGMGHIDTETKVLKKKDFIKFKKKKEKFIIKITEINSLFLVEYLKSKKNDEFINSNVIIASIITAKARIKLYKGFISIKNEGGRILYCDTDSIFCAFEKNMDNRHIGEVYFDISKQDTKIKNAIFALPKAYSIKYFNNTTSTKIKGVTKNNLSFEEFKNHFINNTSKKVLINILKKSNYIITPVLLEKIIILNNYDKRIFIENFTNTIPLIK